MSNKIILFKPLPSSSQRMDCSIKVDYYFPVLDFPSEELNATPIGRFGRMRKEYLKKNEGGLYQYMKLRGELHPHLLDVEAKAWEMMEKLTEKMAEVG